jgi:hypothetical protein
VGPYRFTVFDTRVLGRLFGPKKEDIVRRWRKSVKMVQVDHAGDMSNACRIIFSKSQGMIFAYVHIVS